jgi:hypothetical protein
MTRSFIIDKIKDGMFHALERREMRLIFLLGDLGVCAIAKNAFRKYEYPNFGIHFSALVISQCYRFRSRFFNSHRLSTGPGAMLNAAQCDKFCRIPALS